MRTVVAWQETPPEKDGIRNVCYDLCFKPDGTQLVAGVGNRVLVYDAVDGDLLHALKGHKDSVYCVAYALNGKRFASGGADNTVIIWTSKAEGILKYTHNESIQALAYNPITQQLASATAGDVGLWSPEQKSVAKHKVSSRICALSWTPDGHLLAMGCFDGSVIIRDKAGTEKTRIETGTSPVWAVSWNPSEPNALTVGCFDGGLKFYTSAGQQRSKDRNLGFDPLSIAHFSNGEYLAISGTDKSVQLYTRDGTFLTQIASRDSWVWCVRPRPRNNFVALGCEDGTIACYQLIFSTVHGLYHERYAYRDQMTDVIIQHLITEQKVRIKCKDYVKKIAVYKDKLAVQLSSKVVIYELANPDDPFDMHYQSATKIQQKLDCNLLVVTSSCVILCQERKLQLLTFDGDKEREWVLDSVIRYIKVVGGPVNREGLLVGLKSGQILKIFVDNPFPIPLIKHTASVRCLDLSASRNKLAVVDENANVLVFNLITKEMMFEEKNANSVAWNTEFEDMFCYSGNGMLSIKTSTFPLHQQKLQGFVVGFKGSKIFCLHLVSMQTIDVPQSASMYRYLEKKDVEMAYKTACLGVTEADWRSLALETLQSMNLEVARKCFIRIRDVRHVELVNRTEQGRKTGVPDGILMAEIMAYQGRYQEAARLYTQAGSFEKAMEMFSDLRQFDEAKKWAEEYSRTKGDTAQVQELINKQAEWSEETKNFDGAAEMYIKAKKYDRAIAILAKHAWWEKLITVVREVPREDKKDLNTCVQHFRKAKQFAFAKETLLKLDDTKGLISLYVEDAHWDDAFLLLNAHPEASADVYLPYAKHLLAQDKFDEARQAYDKGGFPELATRILEQLAANAVHENRFDDASFFFFRLSMEALKYIKTPPSAMTIEDRKMLDRFSDLYDKSEVYYAYSIIYKNVLSPFKSVHPVTLFNCARFLLMRTLNRPAPLGVSMVHVVYTLARHSMELGAFKLARFAYNKLQTLVLPPPVQAEVDVQSILVRARPFHDAEELLPVCYRCSTTNPLLNTQGDYCINCGAPFIRSFVTFEHLPLVEFELDAGISDEEAKQLLGEDAGSAGKAKRANQDDGAPTNVLTLDDDDYVNKINDAFTAQQMVPNQPIVADRATLRRMKDSEVMVRTWPNPHIPHQFFRVMDQEVPFVVGACGHFYEQDEYEMEGLEKGHTPFSREPLRPEQQQSPVLEGPPSPRTSSARNTGGTLSMASIKKRAL
mmetsp:Transcript_18911/g.49275  ORF Transcript_18911/g.49275 Transcript_18911/m.49275 type:complete len:1222 (+) Transcript_18911:159-3824(+)